MILNTQRLHLRTVATSTLLVTNIVIIAGLVARGGSTEVSVGCYIVGVAITLLLALMIAQTGDWHGRNRILRIRHCPVCDHRLWRRGKYCGECGSRV